MTGMLSIVDKRCRNRATLWQVFPCQPTCAVATVPCGTIRRNQMRVGIAVGACALAFTGGNLTGWVVFGVVLLVAAVLAVFAGRRRQRFAGDDATG